MAAANIDGKTWHSFLNRGHGKIEGLKDISGAAKAEGRNKLGSIQVIIEDEISLESSNMDTYMNDYLNYIFDKKENTPYGEKSVVKVGDFMQLKPYGGAPIYPKQNIKEDGTVLEDSISYSRAELNNPYVQFNKNRWAENFKCFELSQCIRQKDDLDFAKLLSIVRYMTITPKTDLSTLPNEQKNVLNFLRSRVMPMDHPNYPHNALHIFPTNKDVNEYNSKMIGTIPGTIDLKCYESYLDQTGSFKPCEAKNAKEDFGLPKVLTIGEGARVMITKNQNVDDKIVNGTIGTVIQFSNEKGIDIIWMRPDDPSVGKIKQSQLSSKKRKLYPSCIPIVRIEANISVANDNSTYKRKQFPLKLCFAATIHKYQGRSLDQIVIGGFSSRWMQGMFYTACTRCRRAEGLILQDFNPLCIKANVDGLREIERIRKHSLIKVQDDRLDFFNNYPSEEWVYICVQNVRSISMHLDDVLSDPIMQAASVLCLTETSLRDNNWTGWQKFSNFEVYQHSRSQSDGKSIDDQRKSGGVAILMKKSLPHGLNVMNNENLEMISTVNEWAGKDSFISCIYKDHEMPKNIFIDKMNNIFATLSDYPTIVAGDFNMYDENNKYNELLNSCAEKYGFAPMVHQGTTIHDHILDQIFINDEKKRSSSKIVILPSYFSDHSLVVLCLKK